MKENPQKNHSWCDYCGAANNLKMYYLCSDIGQTGGESAANGDDYDYDDDGGNEYDDDYDGDE